MGFKTTDYKIDELGISVPTAYAQLTQVTVGYDGIAFGKFAVQRTREDIGKKAPFRLITVTHKVDKTKPIYTQLYEKAKETEFVGWEDAIEDEVDGDEEY